MSLPPEERRATEAAWKFLIRVSRDKKIGPVELRQEARDILRHFPLGGDLESAARSAAPELLGKVEREADQLAQEAAQLSARVDELEARYEAPIPDALNVP